MTCPHPPEHHYRWRGSERGADDEGTGCVLCDPITTTVRLTGAARLSPPEPIHPRVA